MIGHGAWGNEDGRDPCVRLSALMTQSGGRFLGLPPRL